MRKAPVEIELVQETQMTKAGFDGLYVSRPIYFLKKIKLNETKNILFISYDGMTDPLGQSQVIPYMQGLAKAGFKITILSCEKPVLYSERKSFIQSALNESGIDWVPIKYHKWPPVLSSIYDLQKLKQAAKRIHLKHNIHLVHTRAGTPAMIGNWLKKKYGVKFLNDLRDFFADSRVDAGAWNLQSLVYRWVYKFFKKAEADQIRNSDGIVCLTYAAEHLIRKWPEFKTGTPLTVIPCSVDLGLFDPQRIHKYDVEQMKLRLQIAETDFIISYLGSLGGWYLTAEMMQLFKKILAGMPHAKFLFISPHLHEYIRNTAVKFDIPPEKIISIKSHRSEIPLLLSLSNYSMFFIKPCYSKQASSPTKHGELMAMGIPVITNTGVGDVASIVQRYNSGIVLDNFTETSFNAAIKQMGNSVFDVEKIRNGAFEFYSLDKAVSSYRTMYQTILKEKTVVPTP